MHPPPTPLKAATIWGIPVIGTLWAETAPTTPPRSTPPPISSQTEVALMSMTRNVATRAMIIPKAAIVLPERAVSGFRRRLIPTTNSTAATR